MTDVTDRTVSRRWPAPLDGQAPRIWYGGDYNPEQWPREVWDEDIALMQQAKVNLVSLGIFSWARLQPAPDQWDFEWLDCIIDKLGRAGIAVDLASATASVPPWLSSLHPEILRQDENLNTVWPGARQAWRATSPVYLRYALALCRQLAEHYQDNPTVVSWHLGNEYGCHNRFDYSDDAKTAFADWAKRRYGSLEALNQAWGTDFWSQRMTAWDQVLPPRNVGGEGNFQNPTKLLDFKRFSSDALKAVLCAERDTIQAITPDKPVTTNFMVNGAPGVVDYADWAAEVDFVSNDHYFFAGDAHLDELLYSASLVDGLSGKQPWLLMEHSTSAVNWKPINYRKQPGELVRDSLAHTAMGADGICFFQWRQSQAGAEKFHSAMLPHAGADSQVFRDVCRLGQDLESLADAGLLTSQLAQSKLAIVSDIDSLWAVEHPALPNQGRAQQTEAINWFSACLDLGLTPDMVPSRGHWEAYQAAVFPAVYLMSEQLVERVKAYVAAGGQAFFTYSTCLADQDDHIWLGGYPGPLAELTGLRIEEFNPLGQPGGDWYGSPAGVLTSLPLSDGRHAGSYWADVISRVEPTAEVLATYSCAERTGMNGVPALVRHPYGQGQSVYLGTQLDHAALAEVLLPVLQDLGILDQPPAPTAAALVRVERVGQDGSRFVFLFNRAQVDISVPLTGVVLVSSQAKLDVSTGTAVLAPAGVLVQKLSRQ